MEATSPAPALALLRPFSKWWVYGLLIAWVLLIVVGGIVFGVGYNGFDGNTATSDYQNIFLAGLGLLSVGGAVKIAFWIVFTVRKRQEKRYRSLSAGVYASGAPVTGPPLAQAQKPVANTPSSILTPAPGAQPTVATGVSPGQHFSEPVPPPGITTELSPDQYVPELSPAGAVTTELSSQQYISELAPTQAPIGPRPPPTMAELPGRYTPQQSPAFISVVPNMAELRTHASTPMTPPPPIPSSLQAGIVARYCGHCGTAFAVGNRFCTQCGAQL
jgi:hypothetical protein